MRNFQKLIAVFALLFCAGSAMGFAPRPTSLSPATSHLCASAPLREKIIVFDTAGNRVAETNGMTGVVANRLCNGLNQFWSCTYDADGNLTGNAPWTYTWDAENRLVGASSNGLQIATYQYDSQNRRISKTVGTTTYRYIYDGWNLVAEVGTAVPSGPVTTNFYVWGADHTGSLSTDSGGVRALLAIISGTNVFYPVMNNHGDVMALFDASGTNIVARYERDPFGVETSRSGSVASLCPFGFQSKYCDQETGLVYFGERYYSPTLGIFISRDPLQEEGGENLYGYGKGCPLAIDPTGLIAGPEWFVKGVLWLSKKTGDDAGVAECQAELDARNGIGTGPCYISARAPVQHYSGDIRALLTSA